MSPPKPILQRQTLRNQKSMKKVLKIVLLTVNYVTYEQDKVDKEEKILEDVCQEPVHNGRTCIFQPRYESASVLQFPLST